jgi:hypothetical protein
MPGWPQFFVSVPVEPADWCIHHMGRLELVERSPAGLAHARGLIFKECLVGRNFSCLCRSSGTAKFLQPLPPLPTELVVVPHIDEWPARARILQIRVLQIRAINGTIVLDICGDVKILNLLAVRVSHQISHPPVVHALRAVFRIPNNFINEIAEVKHETELILLWRSLIFKDHPPIRVLRAIVRILAADKGKTYRSIIVFRRSRHRAPDPASKPFLIGKAIPVNGSRLKSSDKYATRPVGFSQNRSLGTRNHALKRLVF